jgi:hypothetical protein
LDDNQNVDNTRWHDPNVFDQQQPQDPRSKNLPIGRDPPWKPITETNIQIGIHNNPKLSLNDMPTEIMANILSYLTFKDTCRIKRTNTRMRDLAMMPEFWQSITIPSQALTSTLINAIIAMGTKFLHIPQCSFRGNWLEFLGMQRFLVDNTSKLEYLGLQGFEGDDNIAALIIHMSKNLTVLDLSETRFALMTTIINRLPTASTITALDLSAIGGHTTQKLGDMYTNPFLHDTVKLLVDKCRQLTDLIIFGTKLTYDSIKYVCNHLTPTILRLNIARERVHNKDIKALTKQCLRLQYLNISETLVDYQAINDIVQGWRY